MQIINEDENCIMLEFEKNDKLFEWFLNVYKNSELDGKLVFVDEKMLLRVLNSRKCYLLNYESKVCEDGIDQTIKIRWKGNNVTTAEAEICVHGPNSLFVDSSDGFLNYNLRMDSRNWIYFSDVKFISEYEGSYESRILSEFEYAKNRAKDSQIVQLVYGYQEKLRLERLQDEILGSLNREI